MLKVGLTGGLATGKSFVGAALADMGCHLIKADELGHQVLLPGGEAYDGVVREFGAGILNPDGTIDRKRLASEVFGNPERLAALTRLVHPPVIRREEEFIAKIAAREPDAIAVVEAAILIETGSYKRFDTIILAVCGEQQQVERAVLRDGADPDEIRARIRRQMPLEEKRKYATYIIDTSGSKEDTLRQTRAVYNLLRSIPQCSSAS
ncbi:MAG TPA: dephospho-CoA kinase [Bryobacteraceae bacterium]|nr:dephospho-CoA kinase [Bryobacteraceae bacterium]